VGIPCSSGVTEEKGLEHGLIFRIKNNNICMAPPYNWTDNQFDEFYTKIKKIL